MRLHDIMNTDVHSVSPDDSAESAFERMQQDQIHHLIVMNEERVVVGCLPIAEKKTLVGIITISDLLAEIGRSEEKETPVRERKVLRFRRTRHRKAK